MPVEPPGRPPGIAERVDHLWSSVDRIRDHPGPAVALLALVAVAAGLGWWLGVGPSRPPVEDVVPRIDTAPPATPGPTSLPPAPASADGDDGRADRGDRADREEERVVVHVVGAVARPGLVELAADARVADAILAAGGATPAADVQRLNLATPLADGMQIRVPALDDGDAGPLIVAPAVTVGAAGLGSAGADPPGQPVDLNAASAAELDRLPGVGPAIAAAIITWREDHGGFAVVDDLLLVPGIGPAKLEAIRDLVTL